MHPLAHLLYGRLKALMSWFKFATHRSPTAAGVQATAFVIVRQVIDHRDLRRKLQPMNAMRHTFAYFLRIFV
jgi:hypothetical protein